MKKLFELIFNEANKSRFLKPLWDKFSNKEDDETFSTIKELNITYGDLLNFVNSDDKKLKDLFQKNKIDWQTKNKDHLKWSNIILAYKQRFLKNKEKEAYKAVFKASTVREMAILTGLNVVNSGENTTEADFVYLPDLENDTFSFYVPMTWEACVFCDSFQCGGQGAKWCLGQTNSDKYWRRYTSDGDLFIFAFNKKEYEKRNTEPEDKLKFMIQLSEHEENTQAWLQSDHVGTTIPKHEFINKFGHSAEDIATAMITAVFHDKNIYTDNDKGYFFDRRKNKPSLPWKKDVFIVSLSDFYNEVLHLPEETYYPIDLLINCENEGVIEPTLFGMDDFFDISKFLDLIYKYISITPKNITFKNGTFEKVLYNPTLNFKYKIPLTFEKCSINRFDILPDDSIDELCTMLNTQIKHLHYHITKEEKKFLTPIKYEGDINFEKITYLDTLKENIFNYIYIKSM